MSIYLRKYKVKRKDGSIVERVQPFFTIETRHPETGRIIRRRGPRDRKSAKAAEAKLIQDLERGQYGLHDPYKEWKNKPAQESITAFIEKLVTDEKDEDYIYITQKRLERVFLETGWKTLFNANQNSFERWRNQTAKSGLYGKKTKPKTLNQYLATLKEFFQWCIRTDRMGVNPLAHMEKGLEIQNENYRRAATKEEIEKFLPSLPSDELRRFYIFLAYSALRRSSLEAIRWDDMHLSGDAPEVTVQAISNKIRRVQHFPLRKDVAAMMADARDGAKGKDIVFRVPTIEEHREYLAAAKIEFDDGHGQRRLDIHAFRKTLHTWMEDAGVDVREASKALGHLHLSTTMKSYREKRVGRAEAGVEKLPSLIEDGKPNAGTPGKA